MNFKLDEEFRQRNRTHNKQERLGLEHKIEEEGCIADALTVGIINGERLLVDGYTTKDICEAKGKKLTDPRCIVFKDRAAALEWIDARQKGRRNLTAEEMAENRSERIDRVVGARVNGQSVRTIAEEEGVSIATIQRDLETATVSGDTVTPPDGKIIGKDDRKQPATKPEKPLCPRCARNKRTNQPSVKNCEMCRELRPKAERKERPEKHDDKPVGKDAFGNELPKRCRDAYQDPWIQETIDYLGVMVTEFWKTRMADGMKKRAKHYPFINSKDFIDGYAMAGNTVDELIDHLKETRPAGVCPTCEGKGCGDCKMSGLVPRAVYANLKKKAGAKS